MAITRSLTLRSLGYLAHDIVGDHHLVQLQLCETCELLLHHNLQRRVFSVLVLIA